MHLSLDDDWGIQFRGTSSFDPGGPFGINVTLFGIEIVGVHIRFGHYTMLCLLGFNLYIESSDLYKD